MNQLKEAKKKLHEAEHATLQAALTQHDGSPTRAARSLGMKHQTFIWRLSKHSDIARTPVRKRRKHLIEHKKQDEYVRLGFARGEKSKYGKIQLTARMYAIIEFSGLSVDGLLKDNPLGMRSYRFVEGCERMTHSDMQTRFRQLLIAEIKDREEP